MNRAFVLRMWTMSLLLFPLLLFAQTQVVVPTVSTVGGKYDNGFPLSMTTTTPNAAIYYTLDGSEPTELTNLYLSPISIDKNTTLRIKAFAVGMTASATVTHSYFINSSHTFPIIALSFKKSDFFNDTTGIYVKYENGLEVPVNIELFEAGAKTAAINQMVGVQIQGSTSAQLPQKSLEIRGSGAFSSVSYPVFPERPFTAYKRFVLRNGGQDWGITLFRDELATSLALKVSDLGGIIRTPDLSMQDFRPSVVYFNGEYWGIHSIRERMNRFYVEQHYNLKSTAYDMVENWGGEINNGDSIAFTTFYNSLAARNTADNTVFEQLKTELDVSNFLDYTAFNVFIDNADWPGNNVRCFRPKPSGKWRFISYDHDFSLGLYQTGGWNTGDATQNSLARLFNTTGLNWPNPYPATILFRKCMDNATFRRDFINRMADMMNTLFKPARISQKIDAFKVQYAPEMTRHANRWGSPFGILWSENIEKMRNFGNQRISEVTKHIQQQFSEVTGTANVTLSCVPASGGSISFSTLNLTPSVMPFTGTYFTGIDIPVTAIPANGYVFRSWSDASLGTSPTINVRLSATQNLTAIFELANPCATDTVKPVLQNCPSNIIQTTTESCAIVTWTAPTAMDNCTAAPSVSSNFSNGSCYPIGTTNVIYTAVDNANNMATCQFVIQINQQAVANDCKKYIVADVNNVCGCPAKQWMPYSLVFDPTATNCLGATIITQSVVFQQNGDGTATLKGMFRDANWMPIEIDVNLSGKVTTPPTNAPYRTFCMQAQPISATSNWIYYTQMTGTYKFGTNAALPIALNGSPFQVGIGAGQQNTTALGASAKVIIGGLSTGQFNILLKNEQAIACGNTNPCDTDTQAPVFSNCPQNTTVTATQTCATVTWTAPTVTDNCIATPSVSSSFSIGSCFPIGTTTVTYTATDVQNNRATCSFNIIVQQNVNSNTADIALSITSDQASYIRFSTLNLKVTARNIGNQALNNINIAVPYPVGVAYGGAPTATLGTWFSYCGSTQCNQWRIPSLAVGATATVTIPVYVTNTATILNASTQLISSSPVDTNAANNQASVAIPPRTAVAVSVAQKTTQLIPIIIQKISPNPTTEGSITVELESLDSRETTFEFFNSLGKKVKTETVALNTGYNKVFFDVLDLETGVYFVVPVAKLGKHVPTKFVKM
ncbi:MAG: CotH kinase family protein [Saprospiraceae bacterium]|nr:CotH kinase family protein [Saprospiraceae bacterium]